jgi:hypothetical protein
MVDAGIGLVDMSQACGQTKALFGQPGVEPELPIDPIVLVEIEAVFSKAVQVIA